MSGWMVRAAGPSSGISPSGRRRRSSSASRGWRRTRYACVPPRPRGRWLRLGLAVAGWTLVLMTTIDTRWTAEQTIWLLAGTMVITVYAGRQLVAVHRAWTALLKPWVYVTPLYVVVAVLDRVRFEPIWRLSGIKRFEDRNGAVDIVLEWGDRAIRLRAEAGESERVVAAIGSFRTAIARAVAAGDIAWWAERDEFAGVRHNEKATERPRSSWAVHVSCQLATGLTGLALMAYALHVNEVSTDERWYRHGGTYAGNVVESQPERSRQQVSLPTEVSPPVTGTARWLTAGDRVAPLEIRTQGAGDYLVKLVDVPSGRDAGTVYVRGGTTVKVEVPLGTYAIRYATGPTWYGYDYLFGPETALRRGGRDVRLQAGNNTRRLVDQRFHGDPVPGDRRQPVDDETAGFRVLKSNLAVGGLVRRRRPSPVFARGAPRCAPRYGRVTRCATLTVASVAISVRVVGAAALLAANLATRRASGVNLVAALRVG